MQQREYALHVAIVKHLESAFPQVYFFHPANRPSGDTEESRKTNAFFNKQMGVKAGVPDLILYWPGAFMECGALEIKADTKQTSKQKTFEFIFTRMGGRYAICRSVKQAHMALKGWGIKPLHEAIREPKPTWEEIIEAREEWKI